MSENPTFLSENPTFLSDFSHPDFRTEKISLFSHGQKSAVGELSESCLSGKSLQQNCPNSACQEIRFKKIARIARILPVRKNASGNLSDWVLKGGQNGQGCGQHHLLVMSLGRGNMEGAMLGAAAQRTRQLHVARERSTGKTSLRYKV